VKESAYETYNDEIDAANRKRAWGVPQSQSWYKSASGRVSQNWPDRLIDYWIATSEVEVKDHIFEESLKDNQVL
jgi:4-hydroxyacetophenone monooxygenase